MRRLSMSIGGLLGGVALTLFVVASVAGYSGQVAGVVTLSSPSGPQPCGTPITVSAVVKETGGALISDQPVAWTFSSGNVAGDSILTPTSNTNASGVATTKVQFACSPHTVVVGAVADAVSGTTTIVVSGTALPRTDTAPGSSWPTMALAALAVVVGMGIVVRRVSLARR